MNDKAPHQNEEAFTLGKNYVMFTNAIDECVIASLQWVVIVLSTRKLMHHFCRLSIQDSFLEILINRIR